MLQDGDAREKQPDQMHDMFPANPLVVSQILLDLLELRQLIRVYVR